MARVATPTSSSSTTPPRLTGSWKPNKTATSAQPSWPSSMMKTTLTSTRQSRPTTDDHPRAPLAEKRRATRTGSIVTGVRPRQQPRRRCGGTWSLDQPPFPPGGPQLDSDGQIGLVDHLSGASGGLLFETAANLAEIGERGQVDGEVEPPGRLGPQVGRGAGDPTDALRVVLDGVGEGTGGQGGDPIGTVAGQVQLTGPVDPELGQQPPQPEQGDHHRGGGGRRG